MVKRLDQNHLMTLGWTEEDAQEFVERDFKIRSGLCPNGHGPMEPKGCGQECTSCGFLCNVKNELKPS